MPPFLLQALLCLPFSLLVLLALLPQQLVEPIKPESFANFPERILRHYLTHVCESSTHDFSVLPVQICKVKCDLSIRAEVMEIVLVARICRHYFLGETSHSQRYVCIRRLPIFGTRKINGSSISSIERSN